MKLTRNSFRIKCGVATVLLALALLPMVDWKFLHRELASPIETWRHSRLYETRQKVGLLGIALVILGAGISICLEFEGDPPPRKDPWEG